MTISKGDYVKVAVNNIGTLPATVLDVYGLVLVVGKSIKIWGMPINQPFIPRELLINSTSSFELISRETFLEELGKTIIGVESFKKRHNKEISLLNTRSSYE